MIKTFRTLIAALTFALALSAYAAPATSLPDQAKKDFADGVTETADTYALRLVTSTSNAGAASTTCAGVTNEVAQANGYTTGGKALTRAATQISSNHACLNFNEATVTWTTASFTARGAYICDVTSGNVVATFDFGSDVPSGGGNYVVTVPASIICLN